MASSVSGVGPGEQASNCEVLYWPPLDAARGIYPRHVFLLAKDDIPPMVEVRRSYPVADSRHAKLKTPTIDRVVLPCRAAYLGLRSSLQSILALQRQLQVISADLEPAIGLYTV